MSRVARLAVDASRPVPATLAEAARILRAGGLVAFPTETFYGLGAHALDEAAVGRVFQAKGRPADKPLLVLVDSVEMVARVARDVPARARRLMDRYWPGPLTLVLAAHPGLPVALTAGTGTIGVRLSGSLGRPRPRHRARRGDHGAEREPARGPEPAHGRRGGDEPRRAHRPGPRRRADARRAAFHAARLTRTPAVVLRTGAIVPTREDLEG